MADVIKDSDVERLVARARALSDLGEFMPVEIMKQVMVLENCTVAEAKEAYILSSNNETLGQYQERVILPFMEDLEKYGGL